MKLGGARLEAARNAQHEAARNAQQAMAFCLRYDVPWQVVRGPMLEADSMRAVLQRVRRAQVEVDGACVGRIDQGWLVLLGIARGDTEADSAWLAEKITNLRGFEDDRGKMNQSVLEVRGGILVVSQFTLLGDCRDGRRPSFTEAAEPALAERLYLYCVDLLTATGLTVATGTFRAMMRVELVNDGPVTFLLDSRRAS
jgi:D-tyrosyl-tRNA(Tyr) deacylase